MGHVGHTFGDLLLQFRARKRGLSQTRLAHLAGDDPAFVEGRRMTLEQAVAEALGR